MSRSLFGGVRAGRRGHRPREGAGAREVLSKSLPGDGWRFRTGSGLHDGPDLYLCGIAVVQALFDPTLHPNEWLELYENYCMTASSNAILNIKSSPRAEQTRWETSRFDRA